jgi:hypothetical protein
MKSNTGLIVLVLAGLGAACSDKATQERNAALEQRIAELEKQVASPSPEPLEKTLPAEADLKAPAADGTVHAAPPVRSAPAPTARREPARPAPARAPRPVPVQDARTEPEAVRDDPRPEPEPAFEPAPRPEPLILPEGTELTLVLETPLSSLGSQRGDAVVARVERAVSEDGRIALPGGSVLRGKVLEAAASGRVKGRARVAVSFESLTVRGRTHELQVSPLVAEAEDDHGRDAKIVGGTAAAGTVIGAIAGGKKGAVKGAVIGGVLGGGAVLGTKGREVELPAGSRWKVRLEEDVRL